MKNNNKLRVSVGTTSYNEEDNMDQFLKSVCKQEEVSIEIIEIIIYSDGSTDRTVEKAKNYNDLRIKVLESMERNGKPTGLNTLFDTYKGDVLVTLDTDVIIKNKNFMKIMTRRFNIEDKADFVGGTPLPLPGKTFIERAANNYLRAREKLKDTFDFENTGHAAHGRAMAFSRRFTEGLIIPADILGDDGYLFLLCKSRGLNFCNERNAVVWYRSPQTLSEYISQASRFIAGKPQLYHYFDQEVVDNAYKIPRETHLKSAKIQLKRNPLGFVFIKLINMYCVRRKDALLREFDARWPIARSTKKLSRNFN